MTVYIFSFYIRIFMYMFLAGLGLLVVVGLHQLLESRKVITDDNSLAVLQKLLEHQVKNSLIICDFLLLLWVCIFTGVLYIFKVKPEDETLDM